MFAKLTEAQRARLFITFSRAGRKYSNLTGYLTREGLATVDDPAWRRIMGAWDEVIILMGEVPV